MQRNGRFRSYVRGRIIKNQGLDLGAEEEGELQLTRRGDWKAEA